MQAGEFDPMVPSVLVVDDTPDNLNLLCGIVKAQGFRARPVSSGEGALTAAAALPPDAILLDFEMPGLSGVEVCRRLKADPLLACIPVIFVTGRIDLQDKMAAFAAGGVDYITRPFQIEEVRARLASHLELRRQRRELQESHDRLRALEARRDSLVHMIVHDLRSPLTAISGFLELAASGPDLPAFAAQSIAQALDAAASMAAMIASVLDVSRMDEGALTTHLEPCDLVALAQRAVAEAQRLRRGRPITLAASSPSVVVPADRDLILRVLQNLLGNAIKFTPPTGDIRVAVEATGRSVRTTVADTGRGVPVEFHEKIFEKFAQVEVYDANERRSTGLGLAFCKLAIEAHGGRIGVEGGGVDQGSRFWFTLPVRSPSPS